MLGAFFGPAYRDWWLSYARNPKQLPLYQNHWLVRESAARAFARGLVNPVFIGPEEPIEIDGPYALLGDHSRTGIMTVDARFIGTHARLSRSMRFVEIARRIAPEILAGQLPVSPMNRAGETRRGAEHPAPALTSTSPLTYLAGLATRALLLTWLLLPSRARAAAYRTLKRLGEMIYPVPDPTLQVRRLPFGLYLKYANDADMANNEFNALRLVHQYTSIPAPKPLDLIPHHSNSLFLMTRVPGVPLWRCQDYLSDAELDAIAAQLTDYLAQLRAIPRKHFQNANPDAVISNTLGGPCRDHRIRSGDPVGPFRDEAAFSRCLRFPDDPARRGHEIVFTHADLNPRNILVDEVVLPGGGTGWRVTGLVDWETAGYYPEYWDYTKALFEGFRWTARYRALVKRVFAELGDYERELDVERRSWESGDGV
ncbi:uncharacterized protein THITE_2145395 [Thermothielavioides terrestris NRRL 8126]|uniref:Aminoglycoside phosphotransferase domain-containing protein n=1 Tax=Thermothielavioides terrestris (strain ATCC 38088 / NRRL 8126) TaxID=578455 RepID=G2R8C7_THETT|nr:uncharacterized protein THITE_2145395 [Thermothielavioides terrestris NRRL 8126]AEO68185.1 hypothetical protein THITE_2145395 [Thermothielavioides terrestris NRRL 8126]